MPTRPRRLWCDVSFHGKYIFRQRVTTFFFFVIPVRGFCADILNAHDIRIHSIFLYCIILYAKIRHGGDEWEKRGRTGLETFKTFCSLRIWTWILCKETGCHKHTHTQHPTVDMANYVIETLTQMLEESVVQVSRQRTRSLTVFEFLQFII